MDENDRHKSFYFITAIIGLILIILEIGLYRITIIPLTILFAVIFIVAVVVFLIIQSDYRRTYKKNNFFFPFLQSMISFGFIACYLFMAANYYFADKETVTKTVPILRKHTIGTGIHKRPTVEVDYDGTEKQLVFYTGQQQKVDTAREVILTIKKGGLSFDIFTNINLK